MENIKKTDVESDKFYEEKLKILQAANDSKTMQLSISREGDLQEFDEMSRLLEEKMDSPTEKYDLYYNGIQKILKRYLPKGRHNEKYRRIIYDEVNVFLNRGKAKDVKTGKRGSDGRMGFDKDMMEIVKIISLWVSESQDLQKLYTDVYGLNEKFGFGHQQYDESSKSFNKAMRGKYEDALKVKGSFLDIVKASVKDANAKTSQKKKNTEE